jgi:hypothetical protein
MFLLPEQIDGKSALLRTEPLGPPALPAPRPRRLQTRLHPLLDQIALELGVMRFSAKCRLCDKK